MVGDLSRPTPRRPPRRRRPRRDGRTRRRPSPRAPLCEIVKSIPLHALEIPELELTFEGAHVEAGRRNDGHGDLARGQVGDLVPAPSIRDDLSRECCAADNDRDVLDRPVVDRYGLRRIAPPLMDSPVDPSTRAGRGHRRQEANVSLCLGERSRWRAGARGQARGWRFRCVHQIASAGRKAVAAIAPPAPVTISRGPATAFTNPRSTSNLTSTERVWRAKRLVIHCCTARTVPANTTSAAQAA